MIFDALIIGAGPAGATSALLLAQAGWSVAIIEKKTFPRRKVCGEFISATSLPLLQKIGIADFYLSQAGPEVRRVGLFAAETILTSAMPFTNHCSHWGRALGREHLDARILNLAISAGANLWQPWEVKTMERQNYFMATIASGRDIKHIAARIIIMANGSWERSLEAANTDPHKPADLLAFKAHFKNSQLEPDLMPLLAFPGGYGGLAHSDSGRVTLSCCMRRNYLRNARQTYPGLTAGEAVLQHISENCRGVRQVLAHSEREGSWLAAGPIRPGIRKRYADGIFFVGNIAGEAHPIVAEGISMAMQSAWLLAQILLSHTKILSDENLSKAGNDYTQQWNRHFAKRIYAAAVFAQLAMRPWAVGLTLPLLKQFPSILTYGAKLSGKVKQVVG